MKISELSKIVDGKLINLTEDTEISGFSIDSRNIKRGEIFFALKGEKRDGHNFVLDGLRKGGAGAVVERVIDGGRNLILVDNVNKSLLSFAKWKIDKGNIRKICVTGSSGKTSTKEFIWKVLSSGYRVFKTTGNFNNLIGIPLSLWNLKGEDEFGVFEVGMSNHGEIFKIAEIIKPEWGIITNIGSVHMMNFYSQRELASAKFELVENLDKNGTLLYNGDDTLCREFAEKFCVKKISIGFKNFNDCTIENLRCSLNGISFALNYNGEKVKIRTKLLSTSFAMNLAFSYVIGREYGIEKGEIVGVMEKIKPFLHRCEVINLKNGVTIVDDTYNSNPEALEHLLKTIFKIRKNKEIVLVIGEMKELGDISQKKHREIGKYLKKKKFKKLFCISGDSKYIALEAGDRAIFTEDYREIFDRIVKELERDTILVLKGSRGVHLDLLLNEILEVVGDR